ncbi:MAG: Dam family site-specific DNA-(adenine-N6)-methyltransferase [Candidatus Hydrogenedentes bacterium]|nr:Dam family site-specific DNA-(adenine-N6)-methyltransferase [Candidatus Hydrogenedentota bacterium]
MWLFEVESTRRTRPVPRPFLKWVGGKAQLLGELTQRVALARPFGRYHEPFVGGGALFFELVRADGLGQRRALLSDNNARLIETYSMVQERVEEVIALLREHKERHGKEHYYAVRAAAPATAVARAARLIYLNKTCFNGLYRENSRGAFNVPMGTYKDPPICDAVNLRAVSAALRRARIEQRPFGSVIQRAAAGDLVYFDPPYHPVNATSSFTAYEQNNFGEADQRELAEVCVELTRRGVKFVLSNSYTPLILELYRARGFAVEEVFAARMVNSKAARRGKISEALVHNLMRNEE